MTDANEPPWGAESSDAELIAAVRLGDSDAFGALYQRHASAARTVAGQYLRSASEADDAVSEAFTKVLAILSGGRGPDIAFRAYLFTVVRRLAFEVVNGSRRTQPTDDMAAFESAFGPLASSEEPALAGFERTTVAQAFRSLPERWQSVLWYSEVEGLAPAAIAPILGLTANGAAALAYRAREGLREAYLQQHLSGVPADECRRANALLGSFVRGGLAKRETAVVEHHLEDCGECRSLVLELGDVSHGMRAVIAPLVLGLAGLGVVGTALPTWGAAGGTLATTGLAVAGGATASGTAASGTATSGTAASSTTSSGAAAAGGTATGSAAGAASAGGIAGLVAAAPALVVGLAAVVVVAAGLGVAALLGVVGGDDTERTAEPATSTATEARDGSTSAGDPSGGQDADPSTDPSSPTAVPSLPEAEVAADADQGQTAPSSPSGSDGSDGPDGADPDPSGTTPRSAAPNGQTPAGPPTGPAPLGPTDPAPVAPPVTPAPVTPAPVTPAPVDPTPPDVSLDLGLTLASGGTLVARQNNTLALSLNNTGLDLVADVAVELTMPSGLTFVPGEPVSGGVFGPRLLLLDGGDWVCVADDVDSPDQATTVRCEVPEILGSTTADLTLDVYAEADATQVTITGRVLVGTQEVSTITLQSAIALAPARLDVDVAPVADLVAGRPGHLAVTTSNLGQVTATGTSVEVPLPPESGVSWRGAGGALSPAGGSSDGWTCRWSDASGPRVASCTNTSGVAGDASSTVVLPVMVEAGSTFDGSVVPVVGHGGVPAAPVAPRSLDVKSRGLSAAALVDGSLQTAHVTGGAGEPVALRVPAGATVRHAEVQWSGADAEGLTVEQLASVELRGEAGGLATEPLAGSTVFLDPPGAGPQGFWAARDVTSVLAAHAASGRWTVTPVPGGSAPADLRWSLAVVYDVLGQPAGSVALLSGPPDAGTVPATRTLALPADGPVSVAATTTSEEQAAVPLVANGTPLPSVTRSGIVTYRSGAVLAPLPEARAPWALSLTVPVGGPAPGVLDTLVVHSSPSAGAAGPLDPGGAVTGPAVTVEPVRPIVDGSVVGFPVSVHNGSPFSVTDVTVTFDLPPGIVTVSAAHDGSACTAVGKAVTCTVKPLGAGNKTYLPLGIAAPAGLIESGNLTYSVTGTDPLTGGTFTSGVLPIVRAAG